MAKQPDLIAARELQLAADNEVSLYPQKLAIQDSLRRKVLAGKYDREKSIKLWMYWVDEAAKDYTRRYASGKWHELFDKPTREVVARAEAEAWEGEYLAAHRREARAKKKKATKKKATKKKATKKKATKKKATKKATKKKATKKKATKKKATKVPLNLLKRYARGGT